MRLARLAIVAATAILITLCTLMFNLQHLSRTIGFDEAYYYSWVDNWENNPIYYPHHLLFGPVSVGFQNAFTKITGITNTAFIQRFKNSFVYAAGLGVFFVLFYAGSRRFFLALIAALLIGVSGALWSDSMHHETATIPAILVNLAMASLLFYKRLEHPIPLIIIYSVLLAVAILLHQMYVLALIVGVITFMTTRARGEPRLRTLRNLGRTAVHLAVTLGIVGCAYFYVGFSLLNLRLHDNPDGRQVYMGVTINGNFLSYFYLLKAYGIWGEPQGDTAVLAIDGYGSSFVPYFWPLHVHHPPQDAEHDYPSNLTFWVLAGAAALLIIGSVPALKRYGPLYVGLLVWFAGAALFIAWWEPRQMEHWIYVSILTWMLVFMAATASVNSIPRGIIRYSLAGAFCFLLVTVGLAFFEYNMTTVILPQQEFTRPTNIPASVWREEYTMEPVLRGR